MFLQSFIKKRDIRIQEKKTRWAMKWMRYLKITENFYKKLTGSVMIRWGRTVMIWYAEKGVHPVADT